MSQDYDAFLADVLNSVPDDRKQGIEEALRDSAVADKLRDATLRQSDYSRKMDELAQARDAAANELNQREGELNARKEQWETWYADANSKYDSQSEVLKRYRAEYGDLEGEGSVTPTIPDNILTTEAYEKRLAAELEQRDRRAIKFADVLTDLKIEHRDRFGEKLNTEELLAHVDKHGLNMEYGYKDYISDRVAEAEKAKLDEQLKQAREEGMREGREAALMPVQPDASRPHALNSLDKSSTHDDRVSNASAAWRSEHPGS
jgi:hypothetical protein